MGWDIQLDPHAEAHGVSSDLVELLDEFKEEFEIQYALLEPDPRLIGLLTVYRPRDRQEEAVVEELLRKLQSGNTVEFLLGN